MFWELVSHEMVYIYHELTLWFHCVTLIWFSMAFLSKSFRPWILQMTFHVFIAPTNPRSVCEFVHITSHMYKYIYCLSRRHKMFQRSSVTDLQRLSNYPCILWTSRRSLPFLPPGISCKCSWILPQMPPSDRWLCFQAECDAHNKLLVELLPPSGFHRSWRWAQKSNPVDNFILQWKKTPIHNDVKRNSRHLENSENLEWMFINSIFSQPIKLFCIDVVRRR